MRKVLFWIHLPVGLVAGLVVFVLCLTGAVLAFEKQLTDLAERDARALPPPGAVELMSPEALIAHAASAEKGNPGSIEWLSDPREPVRIRYGRQNWVLLNGYSGEVLSRGAVGLRGFFRWAVDLHAELAMEFKGAWVVAIANACFVFLILSGLFLWWPRQWRWKVLRNSLAIRWDVRGKVRDWNWHNAFGFWFLLPLLFMAASGIVLSFKPVDQWWRNFGSNHIVAAPRPASAQAAPGAALARPERPPTWSDLLRTVDRQYPGWHLIALGNPSAYAKQNVVALTVNMGQLGERTKTFTVRLDKATNAIVKTTGWADETASNRSRAIARSGHTGEILGFWGQMVAFLGCLAGCMLVYTGFALSWRRFFCRQSEQPGSSGDEELPISAPAPR